MRKNLLRDSLVRESPFHMRVENPYGVPVSLLANGHVPVEADGIDQLLGFLEIQRTAERLWEAQQDGKCQFWGDVPGGLVRVVITPDFHKGGGIPVGTVAEARGFVIPQAVGNDVCCGMRLLVLDGVTKADLEPRWPAIQKRLREIFFEGKRDIPLSAGEREAMLRGGPKDLHDRLHSSPNRGVGLWRYYDFAQEEKSLPGWSVPGTFAYDDYIRAGGSDDSRDNQIGSVGGGNHFVEIQAVDEMFSRPAGWEWGLRKGAVTVMIHTGSVGLGHAVGGYFKDMARSIFPAGLQHPENGFYFIPTSGPHAKLARGYIDAMLNAANFALVNRLCLGLMVVRAISEVIGRHVSYRVVGELPHNLTWENDDGSFLHRKGACPATSSVGNADGSYFGDPVIIPGSMGAHSFVLEGLGNDKFLASACHGAGRSVPRGKMHGLSDDAFRAETQRLRIVTPIDPESALVKSRRDIMQKYVSQVKEEMPAAYKPILPVIDTIASAGVAAPVARMWPLLTIKG